MVKQSTKLNKRQDKILEYISQGSVFSTADILSLIEKDFAKTSRITIVRDLTFLVEESYLTTEGAGRSVKYYISPQYNLIREIDVEKYFSIAQDKREVKETFDFNIFKILKNPIFTESEKKKLDDLQKQFQNNFKNIKSDTIIKKELERILIEFSWKSSQIEGNTYSLLDTEILIKENKEGKGKTREETQMILNHKTAFEFVLKNKKQFKKLSRANVEKIHSLLIDKLEITKNLRQSPVGITGTNYRPLDNKFQIEEAVDSMIDLINQKKDFFEKTFLSLILLSYIQAFEDGNKRTARMVANTILLAYDSTPMSYRAVDEVEYKKATLLFYESNNLSYFKKIFIEQFTFAVENYFRS